MEDKITIIIPTYNRHRQLARLLDYYSKYNISIIIADSTTTAFLNIKKYKKVRYYHLPRVPFVRKLLLIYKKVRTKYVLFCGDDDFVLLPGINKSVEFLEKNPDYNSAHGHYIFFTEKEGEVSTYPSYLNSINIDINSSVPSERLKKLLSNYMQLWYAVTRTVDETEVFDILNLHKKIQNGNLVELLQAITMCINGKSKILPIFYCAREATPNSAGIHTTSLEIIATKPQFRQEYTIWLKAITEHLMKKEKLSYKQAKQKVTEGINNYLKNLIIVLPFVNIYTLEIQKFIVKASFGLAKKLRDLIIKPKDYKNLPKHTFLTPLGKNMFSNIREYITKHSANAT